MCKIYFTCKEEYSLRKRLKELRLSKNFTQQQMADVLFISRSCWSNYENGHRIPNIETIQRIADFFEVDINYVMGYENVNREIDEMLYRKMKASKIITSEGHLDISDLCTMDKIEIIEFYEFLKIREKTRQKMHNR